MALETCGDKKKNGHGGRRPGAGQPRFAPTDEERRQVKALSGYGLGHKQIASLIRGGISPTTLEKWFHIELDSGHALACAQVGRTLFEKAMGGDTTAMIWWSKTQMRWRERNDVDVTVRGSKAPKRLSKELLDQIKHEIYGL